MQSRIQAAMLGLLFAAWVAGAPAPEAERFVKAAERLRDLLNAGDYAGIEAQFDPAMSTALPLDKAREFLSGLTRQLGQLQTLDPPRLTPEAAIFTAHFERGQTDMTLALDARGLISGLLFRPHTPSRPAPTKHKTQLSLPFKDRWLVFWGGDTAELNHHHEVPNQRFAFDLVGVDELGKTRRGLSDKNEDYYAFGRDVLAPADGTVIEAIDGVRDNEPGSMNEFSAVGNCVLIQHRNNEVSVLAHFRRGSLAVKVGDQVKRGQVLGRCGNSGNSSEPHLHYHLQDAPVLQDGLGIKCVFQTVVVSRNGKTEKKTNYSPVKGEIISPE